MKKYFKVISYFDCIGEINEDLISTYKYQYLEEESNILYVANLNDYDILKRSVDSERRVKKYFNKQLLKLMSIDNLRDLQRFWRF